jgi:hypothetical protein
MVVISNHNLVISGSDESKREGKGTRPIYIKNFNSWEISLVVY